MRTSFLNPSRFRRWKHNQDYVTAGEENHKPLTCKEAGETPNDPSDSLQDLPHSKRSTRYKYPTFTAAALFFLILSGPPKFRVRDPEASLHADTDWVVILHLVVWGLAGLWVLIQIVKRSRARRPLLNFNLPQALGLAMILSLGASVWVSSAPALTAFKVYQMLVSMLFTQIFLEKFGPRRSLRAMFWGNTLLCIVIAFCAVWAPDVVWAHSDFDLGPSRLRGDLIASTGVVSSLAIILSFASIRRLWSVLSLALLSLLLGLLALSLMRTAYLAVAVFFALVLLLRPQSRLLKHFVYAVCFLLLALHTSGWLPQLNHYRDPETISTLSERTGLWQHLVDVTMSRSPWHGLGYYSASRLYGPEYNPGFGTAHSMFIEVLLGGGLVAFSLLVALCIVLSISAARLLWLRRDLVSFVTSSLLVACLFLGFIGEEIDSGPAAICFWYAVAALPTLSELPIKRIKMLQGAKVAVVA